MEKIYTKKGYSYVNKDGRTVDISRDVVVKSISDQNKILANIQKNIATLENDLQSIDNV
jgi:hypothetical protein